MKQGKVLVIEGTDGSGKETQVNLLEKKLKKDGLGVVKMNFPRYDTPTGRIVGQAYLGKDINFYKGTGDIGWFGEADKVNPMIASVYYAADRLAAKPEIEKAVGEKKVVLLDRYRQSNMGHQAGKIIDSRERIKFAELLHELEINVMGVYKEDEVIFLYTPWQVAQDLKKKASYNSGEKLDLHETNPEHLKRAEATYLDLAQFFKWKQIDCAPGGKMRLPENINDEVYKYVSKRLEI